MITGPFLSMPLIYMDSGFIYRPAGGSETVWDWAVGVDGLNYRSNWQEIPFADPVIHGVYGRPGADPSFQTEDYGVFWVTPEGSSILYHSPLKQDIDHSNFVLSVQCGDVDELTACKPNDLLKRVPADGDHPTFGDRFDVLDDSFLSTTDTGFMDAEPINDCRAAIHHISYLAEQGFSFEQQGLPPI